MTLHLGCALMSKCMHAVAHMGHIHTYEHTYVLQTCRHTHSKEREQTGTRLVSCLI